ncbi:MULTISPECIES: hypothetical protein [Pseudomonas]|uniref:hypothetical protein n=1 Tax=Pseudomonas TaxID=286 RepID=UPI001AEB1820|nr:MULTISPECIES: hypothetical protein [unclassified Pseudomonas]MBP1088149.1 hypothetical protein [Pseudomonas sp. PvP007]MBP1196019.1 hypothetical protein [Pseudomonas sp. PvP100]
MSNPDDPSEFVPAPDMRGNKPFGVHETSTNTTAFFQKIIKPKIGSNTIAIAIPNEITLAISVATKSLQRAKKIKVRLERLSESTESIYDHNVGLAYDYLECIQTAIIFAYKAVESFCNAGIPDSYTYKKSTNKSTEYYNKEQIERWISTSDKVSSILPVILKCPPPQSEVFWSDFKSLERLRNEIIHSKSSNTDAILEELFAEYVGRYINSAMLLLKFFIAIDPSNPIFPLGFGKSMVRVVNVEKAEDILGEVDKI